MCSICLNSPATCFLYKLQFLRVTLLNLALMTAVSGMKMESWKGVHLLINSYYQLDCQVVTTGCASVASSHSDPWHQHLGHVNGVSKRMNRNLVESAHSMIAHAGLLNILLNILWAKYTFIHSKLSL